VILVIVKCLLDLKVCVTFCDCAYLPQFSVLWCPCCWFHDVTVDNVEFIFYRKFSAYCNCMGMEGFVVNYI
jgi:hypothetical protein